MPSIMRVEHPWRGALLALLAWGSGSLMASGFPFEALVIAEQGSFAAGGTVLTAPGAFNARTPLSPAGQSFHGDHAYAFYQIPANARAHPIIMLHGAGQFSKTWETTADGREGFQSIFLRQRYPVVLVDQPRRGDAGRSTLETSITPTPDEQFWFSQFRIGLWPEYFDGVQFARDGDTLNQFFRAMTPNTGPYDMAVIADGISSVFERMGPGILFTHSQGGGPGWLTAVKNNNVRAIIGFEPGSNFIFPDDEIPADIPSAFDTVRGIGVSRQDFMALTRIPILMIYGDYIPDTPVEYPTLDAWRARLQLARVFTEMVNRNGGDATLMVLPEHGIHGNTHFPMSDLNNREIADVVADFLHQKQLD